MQRISEGPETFAGAKNAAFHGERLMRELGDVRSDLEATLTLGLSEDVEGDMIEAFEAMWKEEERDIGVNNMRAA